MSSTFPGGKCAREVLLSHIRYKSSYNCLRLVRVRISAIISYKASFWASGRWGQSAQWPTTLCAIRCMGVSYSRSFLSIWKVVRTILQQAILDFRLAQPQPISSGLVFCLVVGGCWTFSGSRDSEMVFSGACEAWDMRVAGRDRFVNKLLDCVGLSPK